MVRYFFVGFIPSQIACSDSKVFDSIREKKGIALKRILISAVIITHSHSDHYGGSLGVIENLVDKNTRFYVPLNYINSVVGENVYVGVAMSRRAKYQYGIELHKDEKGQIDIGIGKGVSTGNIGFSQKVIEIKQDREIVEDIDGYTMEFLLAMNTEAPSEMFVYIPKEHSLCIAEDCNATFHNVLTLRGAKVRDPIAWADSIQKAIDLWGKELTTVFGVHNWPRFSNRQCIDYWKNKEICINFTHIFIPFLKKITTMPKLEAPKIFTYGSALGAMT